CHPHPRTRGRASVASTIFMAFWEARRISSFQHGSCSAIRCCPSTNTRTATTPPTTGPTRPLVSCAKCVLLHPSSHSSSTLHTTQGTRHGGASPADLRKYRGRYDAGWTVLREARYKRQLELGIIPPSTKLAASDPMIPDWDQVAPADRRLYARH